MIVLQCLCWRWTLDADHILSTVGWLEYTVRRQQHCSIAHMQALRKLPFRKLLNTLTRYEVIQ